MIGIKSIASYVPVAGVDNYAQGAKFEKDEEFILGKIGSAFLPRKDADRKLPICAWKRPMRCLPATLN
jgi:3-oxoacyl-[acyl-carrier-protein] synthase-3